MSKEAENWVNNSQNIKTEPVGKKVSFNDNLINTDEPAKKALSNLLNKIKKNIPDNKVDTIQNNQDNLNNIQDNLNKDWNWSLLSYHPNITLEIIQNNPDKEWDWYFISRNPNITWEIIQNNPDKNWNWYEISCNPNITWEIIQNNPDKDWDWEWLSGNTMEKGRLVWINNKRIQIIKALQIQRHWRNYSCNPVYELARRLILKRLKD